MPIVIDPRKTRVQVERFQPREYQKADPDREIAPVQLTPEQEHAIGMNKLRQETARIKKQGTKRQQEFEKQQKRMAEQMAGTKKRKTQQARKGLLSTSGESPELRGTILTGATGILGDAPQRRKTLLGL